MKFKIVKDKEQAIFTAKELGYFPNNFIFADRRERIAGLNGDKDILVCVLPEPEILGQIEIIKAGMKQ